MTFLLLIINLNQLFSLEIIITTKRGKIKGHQVFDSKQLVNESIGIRYFQQKSRDISSRNSRDYSGRNGYILVMLLSLNGRCYRYVIYIVILVLRRGIYAPPIKI